MKVTVPTLTLLAGLLLSADLLAQSGNKPNSPPEPPLDEAVPMIRVQVELIEVPHVTMTALLASELGADGSKLRAKVGDLTAKKDSGVHIRETLLALTRSKVSATSESIEEFIYPTEYEPAELPSTIQFANDGQVVNTSGKDFATGPTPTAFETRNLGSTLGVLPQLTQEGTIGLRLDVEMVYHVRNETYSEWKGTYGDTDIVMPVMYSIRNSSTVTLRDGEPLLVAAHSPKDEKGSPDRTRKLLVFVKADVLK